eukprot:551163-Amphidinium_carterae.1
MSKRLRSIGWPSCVVWYLQKKISELPPVKPHDSPAPLVAVVVVAVLVLVVVVVVVVVVVLVFVVLVVVKAVVVVVVLLLVAVVVVAANNVTCWLKKATLCSPLCPE